MGPIPEFGNVHNNKKSMKLGFPEEWACGRDGKVRITSQLLVLTNLFPLGSIAGVGQLYKPRTQDMTHLQR